MINPIILRPMKPATLKLADFDKLKYPLWGQIKYDGYRLIIQNGKALSSTLKPIRNDFIRTIIEKYICVLLLSEESFALDCELIAGETFEETSSNVSSKEGTPKFTINVFDCLTKLRLPSDMFPEREFPVNTLYTTRYYQASNLVSKLPKEIFKIVINKLILNKEQLLTFEEEIFKAGNEGIILRSLRGPYKFGRSSLTEGYLMKYKRFLDAEAIIINFEELHYNFNTTFINALGYQTRSSKQANKLLIDLSNTLGALVVKDFKTGVEFKIGTGFSEHTRNRIWKKRKELLGKIIKYKYTPYGIKDKPKGVFLGFRDIEDMT